MWIEDFKSSLETLVSEISEMKSYTNECTESSVCFTIAFSSRAAADSWTSDSSDSKYGLTKLETRLKMWATKPLATTNMHLFNRFGQIRKYCSPTEIIEEFYDVRMDACHLRKKRCLEQMQADLLLLTQKVKFVDMVATKELDLMSAFEPNDSKAGPDSNDAPDNSEGGGGVDNLLSLHGFEKIDGSFRYLLSMPMSSVTRKRKAALERERDAKIDSVRVLESTTASDMYLHDLDRLEMFLRSYV
jgi:DNA topoisomerase-2